MKRTLSNDANIPSMALPDIPRLRKVTQYSQPREVAYFSYDQHRRLLLNSREALEYYQAPSLPLDLNKGYPHDYITRNPAPERLDALLKAIGGLQLKSTPKFCTWRGIITKIMCTPYALRDDWELGATLYKGTIYLEEHESNDRQESKFGKFDDQKLFCYYGYKFESCCTSGESDAVNTNVQYCSIFTSKLGDYDLLLGGEVDCLFGNVL